MNNNPTAVIGDTLRYIERMALESALNNDCKCESNHVYVPVCSETVTHTVNGSCEGRPLLICLNVATEHIKFMRSAGTCSGCGRLASECWSIRPV